MIYLCGVETPITILCAGLLGLPTGASEYRPRVDVVGRTTVNLKADDVLGSGNLRALMREAGPVAAGAGLPLQMAYGNALVSDVDSGTVVTADMVVPPVGSSLWELRSRQDRHFLE